MAANVSFGRLLRAVIVPTSPQVLAAFVVALAVIATAQSQAILNKLGIPSAVLSASEDEFHTRLGTILRSSVASHVALVTFWAVVGLVAYLICWGAYNILIEARNEVTLNTTYTNRGHWRGPHETLALKAVGAVGLALIVTSLFQGVSFWVSLASVAVATPTLSTVAGGVLAVIGFAVQLYLVLVFVQLTFTPWYRAEAFTDA